MLSDSAITARDVARAEERVRTSMQHWQRFDCREVEQQEFSGAIDRVSECRRALRQLHSMKWEAIRAKFVFLHLAERLLLLTERSGAATCNWLVGGLIIGAGAVALTVAPLILMFGRFWPFLAGAMACFFVVSSIAASVLFILSGRDLVADVQTLRARLEARNLDIARLHERLDQWNEQIALLRQIRVAQVQYEKAAGYYAQMVELLKSRRYQLAHSDWRALRGTPFEDFIAEVFEELGFTVEKTKMTGDQGVDLIVTGKGRKIAVQVKGYKESVSNKAVQEVHTGMVFYGCRECAVVTNSRFTSGAIDLAHSVGCMLIDGARLPSLINGQLY